MPTSVQFAQAILESGGGNSRIAKDANNHFGIRCGDGWDGETHHTKSGCWRCYSHVGDSYIDHAKFLHKHYNSGCGKSYEYWKNFEGYGGKGYWRKVHKIIEKYKLYEYD